MSKIPEEWEKQLKQKPFDNTHFTAQMRENVENRLGDPGPKPFKGWRYAAVLLPLAAVILWFGFSSLKPGPPAGSPAAAVMPAVTPQPQESGNMDVIPSGNGQSGARNDHVVGIASNYATAVSFPSSDAEGVEISLPLTAMISVPVLDDGNSPASYTPPALPGMTFRLPSAMEGKLQAALVFQADTGSAYVLLAPAGWKASAVTGANCSYGVTCEDLANREETMEYSDNAWGCTGCTVGSIGTYFPGKAGWANENGFTADPPAFLRQETAGTSGADARTVRYALAAETQDYQADGAAYYEEGEWGYLFRKLELTASPGAVAQDVTDTILRFFTTYHGPLLLPAVQNSDTAADYKDYTAESLYLALEQRGMKLSRVPDNEEHLFQKELAGKWPDELLIDKTDTPARPDRLSVYTYDNAEQCAAGLEALKLAINRTTNDGGVRIYPHIFRGGKFLAVYWMGGDSAEPYRYDKAIKLALSSLDSK
ncbi:hypothetical protein AMQ83_31280 [Paenibacillus riograndensis]|nr:hypothetical protein AMQ83_31280 [Paenibacillus riograndensis]